MSDWLTATLADPQAVLRVVDTIACVGIIVSSAEWMALLPEFNDRGIFSWKVNSIRFHTTPVAVQKVLDTLMSPLVFNLVLVLRAASALLHLCAPLKLTLLLLTVLVVTHALIHLRCRYGLEGSDQMLFLILLSLWINSVFADERVSTLTVVFLAAQSALSYFAAGVAKLFGRAWREGTAVQQIFNTKNFGHEGISRFLTRHPLIAKSATYFILAFECGFPLVFILPMPLSAVYLATAALFHLTNAFVMGLNVFVWAFLATYPAVYYCSQWACAYIWGHQYL
jgi:hypothetical protein